MNAHLNIVILVILIPSFHHALLKSITFIIRLMHSIIQNLEVKIYVVKKFKRHKIKNHSDGVCVRSGRPDRTHTPQVQNYASEHRPSTRQNICEYFHSIYY